MVTRRAPYIFVYPINNQVCKRTLYILMYQLGYAFFYAYLCASISIFTPSTQSIFFTSLFQSRSWSSTSIFIRSWFWRSCWLFLQNFDLSILLVQKAAVFFFFPTFFLSLHTCASPNFTYTKLHQYQTSPISKKTLPEKKTLHPNTLCTNLQFLTKFYSHSEIDWHTFSNIIYIFIENNK